MIVGVDEVGRGCWAGPVVAGAVLLARPMRGLRDSKKLTKAQRELLDIRIRRTALAVGIGWATHQEVDEKGLTEAVRLAMQRAVADITLPYDQLIIDGNYNFLPEIACSRTIIKADDTVPAVSAASIVAKVARDNWMASHAAKQFPKYGFERHVGYGTPQHRASIAEFGLCELHRRRFAPIKLIEDLAA